jgi:DNA-binding NtrC family response regulator
MPAPPAAINRNIYTVSTFLWHIKLHQFSHQESANRVRSGLPFALLDYEARQQMKTVFIVEDAQDTREILTDLLLINGFRCVAYDNFSDAFDRIRENNPCAVFFGLRVPGKMTAELFLERVRTSYPTLTMIVITGDPHAAATAKEQGADGIVIKPFDPNEVVRLASYHCQH